MNLNNRTFRHNLLNIASVVTTSVLLSQVAFAAGERVTSRSTSCSAIFQVREKTVAELASNPGYDSHSVSTFRAVEDLKRVWPGFAEKQRLQSAITELLNDETLSTFHIFLQEILSDTRNALVALPEESRVPEQAFKHAWHKKLATFLSETNARQATELLNAENLDKATLMRALGQQSAEASRLSLVGSGGIHNPSPDSLVGRYIREARAMGIEVATYVGRFDTTPNEDSAPGQERLYIAIDSRTEALANKIFAQNHHHMMHNHTPGQGTLNFLAMGGKSLYYAANNGRSELSGGYTNGIYPIITLSTTEASNVQNYADLGTLDSKLSKYPWGYGKEVNGVLEKSYCEVGGYASCTHWIFEMPLGDRLVDEYRFPKHNNDDEYGRSDNDHTNVAEKNRVRQKSVGQYTHFITPNYNIEIGHDSRAHRLARLVWGQGKGRMQFWETLGIPAANLDDGSGANPGWVLYTLLGKANAQRVPVVLIATENASTPITHETLKALKHSIRPK